LKQLQKRNNYKNITESIIIMYSKNLKPFLKKRFKKTPVWSALQAVNNTVKYCQWRMKRAKLAAGGQIFSFDPDRIYFIDPTEIQFRTRHARNKFDHAGAVMDGDWDIWGVRWDDHDQIRWLYERFDQNIPWQDTAYYIACKHYIESGEWIPPHSKSGEGLRHLALPKNAGPDDDILDTSYLSDIESLDGRCHELDALYLSVKEKGVIEQSHLLARNPDPMKRRDNIVIGIGRDGDLLFTDGKHRLAIARILGLRRIPVRIFQRHRQWVDFRNEIDLYVTSHGNLYQPMTHVDLTDFRKAHTEMRFDLIRNALPLTSGRLLDIGSNWGFFCRKFEKIGFTCTAAEHDPEFVYYMKKLRRAEGCKFNIIEGDILTYDGPLEFDVVFALSIFHHFMSTEDLDRKLIDFLGRLKTTYMIFEPNISGENIVKNYAVKRGGEDFVEYVLKHSCLTQSKYLGTEPETGRPIYLLS
jgi:hypothetical protein